jgi:hypothetical protein
MGGDFVISRSEGKQRGQSGRKLRRGESIRSVET